MVSPAPPRVSVVIPLYNRRHTIERALRSVRQQTFTDFEVIIVDDGSSDGGAADLAAADPRFRVLRHERNRGAAAARNTGAWAARGAYVAFLDSDDEWLPGKLAAQIALLDRLGPPWDAVASAFILLDERSGRRHAVRAPFRREAQQSLLLGCALSPGSTLVCRRDCFARGHRFDERLRRLEDWDWLLTYARERKLALSDEPVAIIHGNTASHGPNVLAALDLIEERHGPEIERQGALARRMFRSTLMIERAALAYRAGAPGRASALLLRSLLLYPFRGDFLARMLGRLLR